MIYIIRIAKICILKILSPISHKLRNSQTGGNMSIKYTILIEISTIENKILDFGYSFFFHSSNSFTDEKIVPYRLKCAYS
jgi:tRNA U34 5-carboxymethylaminomethyl modifying GTPase MnmE/TrmE